MKLLYFSSNKLPRIIGLDLYTLLIPKIVENRWRKIFFGDIQETLESLSRKNCKLNIVSKFSGSNFNEFNVSESINNSYTQIIVGGIGSLNQERWIIENFDILNNISVFLAVGE